jgi:hypothetical protein
MSDSSTRRLDKTPKAAGAITRLAYAVQQRRALGSVFCYGSRDFHLSKLRIASNRIAILRTCIIGHAERGVPTRCEVLMSLPVRAHSLQRQLSKLRRS